MAYPSLLNARRFLSQPNLTTLSHRFFSTNPVCFGVDVQMGHITRERKSAMVDGKELDIKEDGTLLENRKLEESVKELQPLIPSILGVPDEHRYERLARISKPPKSAMQSGTDNTQGWLLQFDNQQRWENSLMGWVSSGDPLSNLQLRFPTLESAVNFCEHNKYEYFVEKEKPVKPKNKSYAHNFSWNKRTRVSTK